MTRVLATQRGEPSDYDKTPFFNNVEKHEMENHKCEGVHWRWIFCSCLIAQSYTSLLRDILPINLKSHVNEQHFMLPSCMTIVVYFLKINTYLKFETRRAKVTSHKKVVGDKCIKMQHFPRNYKQSVECGNHMLTRLHKLLVALHCMQSNWSVYTAKVSPSSLDCICSLDVISSAKGWSIISGRRSNEKEWCAYPYTVNWEDWLSLSAKELRPIPLKLGKPGDRVAALLTFKHCSIHSSLPFSPSTVLISFFLCSWNTWIPLTECLKVPLNSCTTGRNSTAGSTCEANAALVVFFCVLLCSRLQWYIFSFWAAHKEPPYLKLCLFWIVKPEGGDSS